MVFVGEVIKVTIAKGALGPNQVALITDFAVVESLVLTLIIVRPRKAGR